MKIIFCLIAFILLLGSFNCFADICENYRKKHLAIQNQQKQGHSAKESIRLQEKERVAWQKWQDCKKGKNRTKKKTIKPKRKIYKPTNNKKTIKFEQDFVFTTNNALVVKGKYKGKKQQAWLNYYKMPKDCKKPKSTQQFAACLNEKEQQQIAFEKQYVE